MSVDEARLNQIKARLGSLSPGAKGALYGSVKRLIEEDLPWLIEMAEDYTELINKSREKTITVSVG